MLDDRKAAILRAVVEEYIETAQPVGSNSVARAPGLAVSSATVRNEMNALERDGYLAQPHTSAGRIPTDKGYRFFVDSLPSGRLEAGQTQQVRAFFDRAHGELERMLYDTSRFLSGLTDYAAVVVRDAEDPARIRSLQLVSLGPRIILVVAVLASGAIEKRTLEVQEDVDEVVVGAASARMSALVVGSLFGAPLSVAPSGTREVDVVVSAAAAALVPAGASDHTPQVFVGGASRMANAFDAVTTIRQVLDTLEQQYVLVTLIKDVMDRGLSVAIGAEHGVVPLADCSIVVAPYQIEGEPAGTVGILGPTRMHYEQTLAAVAVVSKRLGQALSKGSEER
ncbi:MAG TPA: heat-inducible transcriptional repressor HrcA [Acidimicrobiales bacterium]|jgi:heat-inducible transcriptional repressor|nr:heat-inducible transcriptional repressor HrcA [Acidimicrobiales bacterium]